VAALPKSAGAVLFLLGDQPQVRPETIAELVLFDRSLFAELLRLSGDTGGRVLIESRQDDVEWLALDVPLPYDIDTPEDYQRHRP